MEIIGRKFGEVWALDEGLMDVAEGLVAEYTEGLGHIDLERVVFVRQRGLKTAKWAGKCFYVKEPHTILSQYTLRWMQKRGLEGAERFEEMLDNDVLDIRYIIALNDDVVPLMVGPASLELVEKAILHHELKHIKTEMDGIEEHDAKDFKSVLHIYGVFWDSGNFNTGVSDEETS